MNPVLISWFDAFLWTLALEQPVYIWLMRRRTKTWWGPSVLCLAVNSVSHPLLWLVCFDAPERVLPMELVVVVLETLMVWIVAARWTETRALRLAFGAAAAANAFSWLVGPALVRAIR